MHRLGEIFYRTSREGGHTLVIVDEAQIREGLREIDGDVVRMVA